MLRQFNYKILIEMSKSKKISHKKSAGSQLELQNQTNCAPVTVDKSGNITIKVLAKPGAKQNNITDISSEGVAVQISAPPVEGEANIELIKYLSKLFSIRKSDITLDRGSKSRHKTILINKDVLTIETIIEILKKEITS